MIPRAELAKKPHDGVFVVHCASAAFQPHFQDFLREKLGLKHYALLAIPGGIQPLLLETMLPKFAWAGWRWTKFLMDLDEPGRIVLIAHEHCRWYALGPIAKFLGPRRPRQEADLRKAARACRERFPYASVELYFGALDQGQPVFHEVR